MNLEDFAEALAEIIKRSLIAPGRPIIWTIIANPTAGGFTIPSRWKRHYETLQNYVEKAKSNPPRPGSGPSRTAKDMDIGSGILGGMGLVPTRGPGHASTITESLLQEVEVHGSGVPGGRPFNLVIAAGGDGTSLETLSVLYGAPPALRSNFAVLRLPMGTGNDGADAWELDKALDLLIHPTHIELQRALKLTTSTPDKGPFLAFNILSVGLDAYVTHMTNKMKNSLPGDSYKLWVDMAALFYDKLYHVGPMDVRVTDAKNITIQEFREKVLLLAMGVSGHRSYGSHKHILPDDRNICVVKQMSLFRKVALKGLFTTGHHVDKKESMLFSAPRVEFRGQYPILAQMDGETVLLTPEDFPAAIEQTAPVIPILKRN
jgi:diacylglycerol kinase family enzyme